MPDKAPQELHDVVTKILVAAGADIGNANRTADALILSELSGVVTHGVHHMARYVKAIKDGGIIPDAKPEIVSETPNTALIKGNWTFGFVTALFATNLAIEKADKHGVAIVSTMQTNHIGRLGEYSELAASRGMISLVFASGYGKQQPMAVPYGGAKPVLHTNPISIGVPALEESPMVLDFATTVIAGSKVRIAHRENKPLPPGAVVDSEGRPTTNPADWVNGGGLLPFGGHKGYAIMLANEMLGRLLADADSNAEEGRGEPNMRYQGVTFIAFKADLFQPIDDFGRGVDDVLRQIRNIPPAPGFKEVMVPGDLENRSRLKRRSDEIIEVPDLVWESLKNMAKDLGIEID